MLFNIAFFRLHKKPLLMVLASVLLYYLFAYYLVRTDYTMLIILYSGLFFMFYKLVEQLKNFEVYLTWLVFIFRAIFLMALPALSQDFYRFIWDGRMIIEGLNPYLFTVESFIYKGEYPVDQAQELYTGMGVLNGSHYTNYPPINQLCFTIAGLFAGKSIIGSVMVMRIIIIAADFGTLHFGKKLLEKLKIPTYNIFWYLLNPFIIIELTGNLHFEGVMIFFLIWSLYLIKINKWQWAGVLLAVSISVKLIPLMFLPLFYQWFTLTTFSNDNLTNINTSSFLKSIIKLVWLYIIIGVTTILLFLPFYSQEFISNYTQTVGLWFKTFEFNGSLYYIAREIGYLFRGYNEIAIIGKITPFIVVLFIFFITFLRKNKTMIQLITAMLFVLSFYYFTATTVHPWYVATLLILSVFTHYKFPLVWSFVIILSYLAYTNSDNVENLWVITLEYTIVYSVFIWEVFIKKAAKRQPEFL